MDQNDTNDKDKAVGDSGAISSDLIRGHINTIILRTLYDGDKYGYEIISEIEEKSRGQYALKQPTLYSALKRLESQDYVTSYWGGGEQRRSAQVLPDHGQRAQSRRAKSGGMGILAHRDRQPHFGKRLRLHQPAPCHQRGFLAFEEVHFARARHEG